MIYLLDTNAVSDLMRESPDVRRRLNAIAPADRAITCTIVRGEILYGISRLVPGKRKDDLIAKSGGVFAVLPCEPIPTLAGDLYGGLKVVQQAKGLSLDENDLWIAATALALGATLVTRDHDYSRIEGLSVQDWTA